MKPCSVDCQKPHCVEAREIGNGRVDWQTTKPTEIGTIVTQGQRTDIEKIKLAIDSGATIEDIREMNYAFYIQHKRSLLEDVLEHSKKRDFKTKVVVIYGQSGTGKSRYVREQYPDAYWLSKSSNGNVWWNGYSGQDVVGIDDFYGWIAFDYMLKLLDRYPLTGETKGGAVNIAPKVIVITSNEPPCLWYSNVFKKNKELECAFSRRIDELWCYKWSDKKKSKVCKEQVSWARSCGITDGLVADEEDGDWDSLSDYVSEAQEQREMMRLNREVSKFKTVL